MSGLGSEFRFHLRAAHVTGDTTMRFVNKGERSGKGLYYASRKDDEENCALCTVAGAINLTMGRPTVSTRMVAQMSPQQGMTLGSTPDEQVKSILRLVEERTLRDGEYCGKRAYAEAAAWMAGFADGTVYAMWIEGFLRGNGKSCTHWLNAPKAGNVVRYFDFQANRKVAHEHEQDSGGGLNPATALVPICAIATQSQPGVGINVARPDLQRTDQYGAFKPADAVCRVIAFPPRSPTARRDVRTIF
jgi:hypothetical protein